MKAADLARALAPFKLLASRAAMQPQHRSLQITPEVVRGASSFGLLEQRLALGNTEEFCVDAATFLAVVDSLPGSGEVELTAVNNVVHWRCGQAKGKLAQVAVEAMPTIPERRRRRGWKVPAEFARNLSLGALSCHTPALSAVGMYGVVIRQRPDGCDICASDDTTVSASQWQHEIAGAPATMTFIPDAIDLLAQVIDRDGQGVIECEDDGLWYRDDNRRCLIRQVPPLSKDIGEVRDKYRAEAVPVELPKEPVRAFIRRATALAESKRHTYVDFGVVEGRLMLAFEEGTAQAEEYYLVDDPNLPDLEPVKLNALRVARALGHASYIALDYAKQGVVVLRHDDPDFTYLVAARPK